MNASLRRLSIWILATSAIVLGGINLWLYTSKPGANQPPDEVAATITIAKAAEALPVEMTNRIQNAPSNADLPFEWSPLESTNYKTYIANLRRFSFPEDLIRELIIADVDKLFAAREEPLKWKVVTHDAPLDERRRKPSVKDIENLMMLRDIQIEKQNILQELLGIYVPRPIIRTPNSRNYEAYEYGISQLPVEKREAVQRLQETEFLLDDLNHAQMKREDSQEDVRLYKEVNDKHAAELQKILTAEEYDTYLMNSSPPGTEMARRIIGMEPTSAALKEIWKLTHEQWKAQGGVYGRWRANPVSEEEIAAADQKLEEGLRQALGPDRFTDYQMAVSDMGQQMNNLAIRYGISKEEIRIAFETQIELDRLESRKFIDQNDDRRAKLEHTLQESLRFSGYDAWKRGRNLNHQIDP